MKLAILFSGGKDSHLAMYKASIDNEISCAITMKSENYYSYMFQSLGCEYTKLQLESQGIPQLLINTKGEKEKELDDLKRGIIQAVEEYKIEGIVTGAIMSTYQSSRIQQICDDLNLWCFNPLWQMNSVQMFDELNELGFEVVLLGVFGYPLDKTFVGKTLNIELQKKLLEYEKKYQISAIGEGGEFESFVTNGLMYSSKLSIEIGEIVEESENSVYVKEFKVTINK